ncbi:MAG: cob(I)yrinic acid a,c-diamide adenosyltransferase [Nitrososphaerota archaeon]
MVELKYGSGDDGTTGLLGGVRVPKDDIRVEVLGALDELNSIIGLARALTGYQDIKEVLLNIQNSLYVVGAEIASTGTLAYKMSVDEGMLKELESFIERYALEVRAMSKFVIPYGAISSIILHMARAIARRLERRAVSLRTRFDVNKTLLAYLNRLSTFFFILARVVNARGYVEEEVVKIKNMLDEKP